LAFSTFLVSAAWPHLANFPPISADEVWIMSVSVKLADEGVLGSDLLAGFHGADRHYFLALPVHHLIQAAFFKALGPGVAQARAPSLIAGVGILCAVGWLAYRWGGLGCSIVTGVLLLFWRSNLVATDPRPPLLALAQSGRYDVIVLCLWWLTLVTFNRHLDKPRRATAVVSGVLAGSTALTQFYGAGVLLCCGATLVWTNRRGGVERLHVREVVIGALIPILIYGTYVAANVTDFVGQVTLHSSRLRFYDPSFYLTNILNEWRRFDWLLHASQDAIGAWTVVLALPIAFVGAAILLRRGHRLALVSTLAAFLSLMLLDSTKARIYASLLLPPLCLGFAAALTPTMPLSLPHKPWTGLRVVAGCAVLLWIVIDGLGGYRFVAAEGPRVSPYADVGRRIAASLDAQVPVLGSERWWWALRGLPYQSLNVQWEIWKVGHLSNLTPNFTHMMERFGSAYLILDNDTRGDLTRVPSLLEQQVNDVLTSRATKVASWRDPTYGLIEVYRF
jgi:hypothetical protein